MSKDNVFVIRGELYWAKVLGEPRMNKFTEEREWSVDVVPDDAGLKALKAAGVADKLREPAEDGAQSGPYIKLRQKEYRGKDENRTKNRPISVSAADGTMWPQDKLLGNETIADVKVNVVDNGKGFQKGVYVQAIRVLKLKEYISADFAPLSTDDEFFANGPKKEPEAKKPTTKKPVLADDLDDEIPF